MRIVRNKKLKSFSLIETVATIMIYAAMLLMITNVVLVNARLSEQLKMRTRIRSELSQVMTLIRRDVRNASTIDYDNCTAEKCKMNVANNDITWKFDQINNKFMREDSSGITGVNYSTPDFVNIENVNFYTITETSSVGKRATIIVTIRAKGSNQIWNINNQVFQEIISTRNFGISI